MKFVSIMIFSFTILLGVDINTATKKELSTLIGVGETKAKAIIEHREKNCFKSVDDLVLVKGIGSKTVEKNLTNLSASECK